jgi:3-dehydroquinate dehydratase type I
LARNKPRICAAIINNNLEAVKGVEPLVDLLEIRLDLIGSGWQELAGHLEKPWIACNRSAQEGGSWQGSEAKRIEKLLDAVKLGADIVDLELSTSGVGEVVKELKGRAECLLSYHNLKETPPLDKMREIVRNQLAAGGDICKLVTTARSFKDNIATLQLIADFPESRIVAFAMGDSGYPSRVLCPLVGGYFTYASIEEGKDSAPGQITVLDLRKIYGMLKYDR